ncbi:MAG: hypothetical protein ACI8PZ_004357 [Myxococcota bacterium]
MNVGVCAHRVGQPVAVAHHRPVDEQVHVLAQPAALVDEVAGHTGCQGVQRADHLGRGGGGDLEVGGAEHGDEADQVPGERDAGHAGSRTIRSGRSSTPQI